MFELMQLESAKSMVRWCPPNGTAGFARHSVSPCSLVPLPPARMSASGALRLRPDPERRVFSMRGDPPTSVKAPAAARSAPI